MTITVLKSSPHKNGSSNIIADEFLRGAKDNGNEVEEFFIPNLNIHPCIGCDYCKLEKSCCHNDDMPKIQISLMKNDLVVFVTPLYYFGMSSQLKAVIDRFYAFNDDLSEKHMKSLLISAAWDKDEKTMRQLRDHYRAICDYLSFENIGELLGSGCGTPDMTRKSEYPLFAYKLGKQIE